MSALLGTRIRNFKAFADLKLGQVEYAKGQALPRFACFIGPNGSGKSSLLDAFGFIADCLLEGVEVACDKPHRGGFDRLRTQGATGPMSFELVFSDDEPARPIVYAFSVDVDASGVPQVITESLRQRRRGETRGKPYHFLKLTKGRGKVWAGDYVEGGADDPHAMVTELADGNRLGLTTLGNLTEHPRIVKLRSYVEQWYLSYFGERPLHRAHRTAGRELRGAHREQQGADPDLRDHALAKLRRCTRARASVVDGKDARTLDGDPGRRPGKGKAAVRGGHPLWGRSGTAITSTTSRCRKGHARTTMRVFVLVEGQSERALLERWAPRNRSRGGVRIPPQGRGSTRGSYCDLRYGLAVSASDERIARLIARSRCCSPRSWR